MGMTKDIVESYFLQVGRSYYKSSEFARRFGFLPTSRFGVGFLAVFGVSDRVTVDTLSADSGATALKMTLTGPRTYLLIERGDRSTPGTTIDVLLRDKLDESRLVDRLRYWTRMLEIPVTLRRSDGAISTLSYDLEALPTISVPLVDGSTRVLTRRSFTWMDDSGRGVINLVALVDGDFEDWTRRTWAEQVYVRSHPFATTPDLPFNAVCFNGIDYGHEMSVPRENEKQFTSWTDVRAPFELSLDRSAGMGGQLPTPVEASIARRLQVLLEDHLKDHPLARGDRGFVYI
jgi:hypothetical protein